jgi:hypothetical protein
VAPHPRKHTGKNGGTARAAVATLSVPRLTAKKGKNRYAANEAPPPLLPGAPRPVALTASDVREPT